MFRHYLVAAGRGMRYHRLYSVINILGLSIGLAAAILIALYVRDELSYDKWLPDTGSLYRLEYTLHLPDRAPLPLATAPFPLVTAAAQQLSQVEAVTHVMPESMTVNIGDRQFRDRVTFVDPGFLGVIKLPLVAGDPARVLAEPESAVLSQSAARKFFGSADPIGKTVTLGKDGNAGCSSGDDGCLRAVYPLIVTGVLRDLPHNTQLAADIVVPNTSRADSISPAEKAQTWTADNGDYGYLKLRPGAEPAAALAALNHILDGAFDPRQFGIPHKASEVEQYRLTPFREIHLTSDQYGGMTPGGSWTAVYGLGAIALLIVLTACCNFTNLTTARATLRAREVAVRKLGGAGRHELIAQFLIEAVLLSGTSLVMALCLVEAFLPLYDRFLGRPIGLNYLTDWKLLAGLVAGAAAAGLASGFYPAIVLSGFRPASSLRSGTPGQGGAGVLRSALVIAQFAISIGLGVAAVVVVRQTDIARRMDLGFEREGVVVVRGISRLTPAARDSFAKALREHPQITGVAYSNGVPFDLSNVSNLPVRTQGDPQPITSQIIDIGPEFPAVYGIQLAAGRFLSDKRGADVSPLGLDRLRPDKRDQDTMHNLLINANGARRLGFSPAEALGKEVTIEGIGRGMLVGVLRDTKLDGMREIVKPTLYYFDSDEMTRLSVRIHGEHAADTLAFIDRTWHAYSPGTGIDRYYLADEFEHLFEPDEREGELLAFFVGVAIFIACLGLFGLSVFTAERRTKEIGVRKIAGARTREILGLMLWRISVPVLIANLIAWPVAYYYLSRWLEGHAYRISLSPVYFLAGGGAALLIAWATVFLHTLRLARSSPVHALRYE